MNYQCKNCDLKFNKAQELKAHRESEHVTVVYVGESRIKIVKSERGFHCPSCGNAFLIPGAFRKHLKTHNLKMTTLANQGIDADDVDIENKELSIGSSEPQRKKIKLLDYNSTILATCNALTETQQVKDDKLAIARLGRWKPISLSVNDNLYHVLSSPETVKKLLNDKNAGVWHEPTENLAPSKDELNNIDYYATLEELFNKSKAGKHFDKNDYVEFDSNHSKLLNKDWLLYPNMKYVSSQLLAGAILENDTEYIIINTIEPYDRYVLNNAHHERRFSFELSTFPTKKGKYQDVQVILLPSVENGGIMKLNISSRTCNMLVTSSLRLDCESVNLGATTYHFKPSSETRILLYKRSVEEAQELFEQKNCEPQALPFLYQLKQVRSKFDHISTYSRCRASSLFGMHLEFQPCSIWTLADQDSNHHKISQEKLGSLAFQTIAIEVVRKGKDAKLKTSDLDFPSLKSGSKVHTIIQKIQALGETIPIIGNTELSNALVDLAGILTTGIKEENEKKIDMIKKVAYL